MESQLYNFNCLYLAEKRESKLADTEPITYSWSFSSYTVRISMVFFIAYRWYMYVNGITVDSRYVDFVGNEIKSRDNESST